MIAIFYMLQNYFRAIALNQIKHDMFYFHTVSAFTGIFIGFLMSLEYIALEWRKKGNWRIRREKTLFLVLPLSYVIFSFLLPYPFSLQNFQLLGSVILRLSNILILVSVFLGYSFATSFYKHNSQEECKHQ